MKGVAAKPPATARNKIITKSPGIKLLKLLDTTGGTLDGILIVHPACLMYTYNLVATILIIIAEKIPFAPNHSTGIEVTLTSLTLFTAVGVIIKKHTADNNDAIILSSLYCFA
ncbi:hypothetical protein D3C81_969560 [compost metagenome]